MSQPLGLPPVDTPLSVVNDQVVFKGNLRWSGWLNLIQAILNRVSPFVVNNAFMISIDQVPVYADNAAALLGGLTPGNLYRSGASPDVLSIVH